MRKEELRSLIIYTILIAVAITVGVTVIRDAMISYYHIQMQQWLFVIVTLFVCYLINAIGHELLHVLGAILGGYSITSINILGLCIEKNEKSAHIRFKEFDGLTGETKIAPKKEKTNINLFMWCPFFGFAAEIASSIVIISSAKTETIAESSWLVIAAIILILVSSMMAFYELIPIKLDTMTDGYRLRLFANPINVKAYDQITQLKEKERLGETIKSVPVFEEITEYTAEVNMLAVYFYLRNENFQKSEEIIDILLKNENKLDVRNVQRLIAQKLYIEVLTKPISQAKETYDKIASTETRRFIANDISMESIRAYVLIAGMIEGSQGEVKYALSKVEKAKKRALPSQIEIEEKLMKKAIDFVYNEHPNWEKEIAA